MSVVVDASAVLALLFDERGGDEAAAVMQGAHLSAVNLIEVFEKGAAYTKREIRVAEELDRLEVKVTPLDAVQAERAAALNPLVAGKDISLADRACMALGETLGLPIYTADRAWAALDLNLDIRMIR